MSDVIWDSAPEGTHFFFKVNGLFYKVEDGKILFTRHVMENNTSTWLPSTQAIDYFLKNKQLIVYRSGCETCLNQFIQTPAEHPVETVPLTAADFMTAGLKVLDHRGKEYGKDQPEERSFAAVATAVNAMTGYSLKGSDIALILDTLKTVRQYSKPDRLHEDSLQDKVNYGALWAAELTREFHNGNLPK